ncbi:MAG: hypothetical protein OER80_07755 [Gammaproteobacteria bacterium]|nr:hypothetical protein [Gammaproteobacteria bacterium]
MTSTATAPGKLILIGEFAVLEGAPAIVMAIDRRAQVRVTSAQTNLVTAPEICEREVSFSVDADRRVSWLGVDPSQSVRLEILAQVIARYWSGTPVHIETDTAAFFEDGIKMGFGSSAALTVAASAALRRKVPDLAELIETHKVAQGGRGSGFDIAASLNGGVINFRSQPPEATPLSLPDGLHMRCVWTGHAASTSAFLRGLDALGERRNAIDELAGSARSAVSGLDNSPASWVQAVQNYSKALKRFAAQTSLPIFSGGHTEIAEVANANNVAYKPSGAGGGDLGIAVSMDAAPLESFSRALSATGVRIVRLVVDKKGLILS